MCEKQDFSNVSEFSNNLCQNFERKSTLINMQSHKPFKELLHPEKLLKKARNNVHIYTHVC